VGRKVKTETPTSVFLGIGLFCLLLGFYLLFTYQEISIQVMACLLIVLGIMFLTIIGEKT